uniref:SFRICE_026058 n=1 Tax=Spodoptera frugiperda TaxID=7108 RepID=A0A2H1W769_SPOFR
MFPAIIISLLKGCHSPGETIRHIISGCGRLANGEYLHRHNQVAKIIHQQLALHYQLVEFEVPYYNYVPDPVLENGHITLYWDQSIITDRTIVANKPDIVVIVRQALRTIINITIPHDENLVKAEKDKQIKYFDLAHEVVDMHLRPIEKYYI